MMYRLQNICRGGLRTLTESSGTVAQNMFNLLEELNAISYKQGDKILTPYQRRSDKKFKPS